jgi:hypothetical protein
MVKPKITSEERAAKRAARLAEEHRVRDEQVKQWAEESAAFKAGMPAKMVLLIGKAERCGCDTTVELTVDGPSVQFRYYSSQDGNSWNATELEETLTYDSLKPDVDDVESFLNVLNEKRDRIEAQLALAKSVFSCLTAEQQTAIKEHIHYL